MSWLRKLVAGLSLRKPQFDPTSVQVRFVADIVGLEDCYSDLWGFPLSESFQHGSIFIIIYILVVRTRRTNGWSLHTFQIVMSFSENAEHWLEEHFHSFLVFKHLIPLAVPHRHSIRTTTLLKLPPFSTPESVSLMTSWGTVDRCKAGRHLALDLQFCVLGNRDKQSLQSQ